MKNYNRIMLGRGCCFAEDCRKNNYIGADFDINEDLTSGLANIEDWRTFNRTYIPTYLKARPEKSKVAAGLACGFLWTVVKGLKINDIVLCPEGKGFYYVGIIKSEYYYVAGADLQHRRKVEWLDKTIRRVDMSESLRHSIGSIGTCSDATKFADEIEELIKNASSSTQTVVIPTAPSVKKHYFERDLHKLMCNYLRTENILGKTIYHEQSSTKKDSNQKWVHPDIVGVRFEDFEEETTQMLQKAMEPKKSVSLYSFEMKCTIDDDYQLKQYFFQALSNSSWANYGYLVAYEIDKSLEEEIARLNAAFGIGVILLQAKTNDTKILFPAKEKELDYLTIDKLCHLNDGFKSFISGLIKVMKATKEYTAVSLEGFEKTCDAIFKDDTELEDYCQKNGIPY